MFSQKHLSGNLRQPKAHVISIPQRDRVIVDSVAGFNSPPYHFSQRDTVLLIQMQGVGINAITSGYGFIQNFFGQPGKHEFLIIQSINSVTHEIIFRNNIIETYDTRGNIQIVRVPYYNSATVTNKLTCDPWNPATQKGGVLALVIGRTLRLKADIDVSARGLIGGIDALGIGRCILSVPTTNIDYYANTFDNAGFKGEGIAIHDDAGTLLAPLHSKGMGPNFTGGGGGNGRFSGGGGGSNMGAGGDGGSEDNTLPSGCSLPLPGGKGGFASEQPSQPSFVDRIFLGGGGGASTSLTGLTPPGGYGGGIVIIVADTIIGDGGNIIANGGTGGSAVTLGGSGGGGGGGSIALSVSSYGSKPLTLSVSGGNGGGILSYGDGGGGGGGLIYVKTDTPPSTVTNIFNGGHAPVSGSDGFPGGKKAGFKAILNGFLFNSVRSSVTGDTLDWICSDAIPKLLTGTLPVGGSGSFTYKWQKSHNPLNIADTIDILSNTQNYQPTSTEPSTVYFRRIVKDNVTSLRDISKWVKIIVQPAITDNIIGKDTTICQGQNPLPIGSLPSNPTPSNGNGIYRYKWIKNYTNTGWDTLQIADGSIITDVGYDPPPLNQPTFFKRFVQSGRCLSLSNSVQVNVLNLITGNIITRSDSVICEKFTFTTLTASAPGQGSGSYLYQWQDSTASSPWNSASGSSTGQTYSPDTSKFSATIQNRFYRRVILSGPHDVCKSKSQPIHLIRFPRIKNNLITANLADLTICSGSTPVALPGSTPINGAGSGSYSFLWRESTDGLSFIAADGTNNSSTGNYQPLPLTGTRWYERIVNSSFKSAVVCRDTSSSTRILVNPSVLNYNISLLTGGTTQTICNGQVPTPFQGNPPTGPTGGNGSYAYQWMYSTDDVTFNAVPSGGTIANYAPPALTTPTSYRRDIISGACNVSSNPIKITVLPLISNNVISGNSRVCYSLVPGVISGASLSGGDGTYKYFWEQSINGGSNWNPAAGTNSSADYQAPALFTATKYRRTVTSGSNNCCSNISNNFDITIDPMPVSPIYAGPPATIYSIDKIYHMQAINPGLVGETGTWSVLDNGQSTIDDTTKYNTVVRNLSSKNVNSFLWTVHRGPCKLSDTVNIKLNVDFEPRAFSPNGDGINDTFIIEGLDKEDNWIDLNIVNGAGTEVFSASNRNGQEFVNWNGKNSSGLDLSEGTYYYMLKVTPKDGTSTSKKSGFIILKRY